ncbi:hypothetical protein [Burkholderia catarinensis]|uniref:hypothetical protein n=1 Tax=Burkholderia catarinensis TaxID=1108140 RepID=UPI00091263D0|nr:hypothetical protein [Burkholderia catarinensis]KAG8155160.1 hypothetical protein BFF94_000810 [Burkholderia catarinensis]
MTNQIPQQILPFDIVAGESKHVAAELDDACDWLESLGLILPGNRFAAYKRTINRYLETEASEYGDKELHELVHALREAGDLIRIWRALENLDSTDFLTRLKKVTGGQAFKWNVPTDSSRDFVFELTVAARFLRGGYPVDLTGIADLVAHCENRRIYVECKRVKSASKILTRTREASKQLQQRLQADGSSLSRGLAAIRVTDALNPDGKLVIDRVVEEFQAICNASLTDYINQNRKFLVDQLTKKQWGILLENGVYGIGHDPMYPQDTPFTFCRGATLIHASASAAQENEILRIGGRICDDSMLR